jgi:hypothetical protein
MTDRIGPFDAELWAWQGPASWVFLSLPPEFADAVRLAAFLSPRGWGSVRVTAEADGVNWDTSLFPDKTSGSYLLPVKAAVRRKLGVAVGDRLSLSLRFRDQP